MASGQGRKTHNRTPTYTAKAEHTSDTSHSTDMIIQYNTYITYEGMTYDVRVVNAHNMQITNLARKQTTIYTCFPMVVLYIRSSA